jgi:hypothetical protein
MRRVILQPAGGGHATTHFNNTVRKPVPIDRIVQFVSAADTAELEAACGGNAARVWGVTPGEALRNRKKWERIESGDVVLFCGKGEVFAYAFVKHKLHSRSLAIELWGKDEKGHTWEYVYFVSQPLTHSISYGRLASAIGFSPDFVVLGLTVLNEEKSAKVIEGFNLIDD